MEKEFGFQPFSSNLNTFGFPFDMNASVEDSTTRFFPSFPNSTYLVPHFDHALVSNAKRFLVFDQSGDKTTLIYNSGIPTHPVQFGVPNPTTACNLTKVESRDGMYPLRPSLMNDDDGDNSRDEMHEDTEELNALLCSDNDSNFSEDDEETSTGHSPSTMTDNGIPGFVDEIGEEVDSFSRPIKRHKFSDEGESSLKTFASSALEDDDAESSRGNDKEELGSWSSGKRSRKDKLRETLSILRSIIPNVDGDDAIVVIDEAIRYLRSLKVKAKAIGLDSL